MRVPLTILTTCLVAQALAGLPSLPTHHVGRTPVNIGSALFIAEDPTNSWSAEDAVRSGAFEPSGAEVPNLGLGGSSYWFSFAVRNETGETGPILHICNPEIDELSLFRILDDTIVKVGDAGLHLSLDKRPDGLQDLTFDLLLNNTENGTYLARVKSNKQLRLPIELSSKAAHKTYISNRNLLTGIYIGIMAVLAIYNLFVYLSIRDKSYLIYVLYILFVSFTQLTFLGIGRSHIWGSSPWISIHASLLLTVLTAIASAEFMRTFIKTKHHYPIFDKIVPYFYIYFGICIALYTGFNEIAGYLMTQIGASLFASFLLIAAVRVMRAGSREAGFFLLAWSVFLIGTLVFLLKDVGLLPYNSLTMYTMPAGAAIEGVLLSFGLADRINILRREKERSQAEALAVLQENERLTREQNVLLEQKVKQRTAALQESNDTLKRTQAQLVNAEKMASLGQLTAGIAHEINNPINFISSNVPPLRRNMQDLLEVLQRYQQMRPGDGPEVLAEIRALEQRLDLATTLEEMEDIVASIAEGSSRTAEIVRGLRNFSRLDEDDLKEADLNEGIRSTLAVLAPQYRDKVAIELDLHELPKVECFPGKINQVFMNIITNAIQATVNRPGDRPRVVHVRTARTADRALVSISDNGVGMTREVIERIYDPFFTTKPVGEGTGLGMAIVYGIVQEHQGDIRVESSPGIGTTFHLELPVRHLRQQSSPAEAA